MCWFAGITSFKKEQLEKMWALLSPRAIDEAYFHYEENCSFYHAHLQVSDLDKDTSQPYIYENILVGLVWEIYNKQYLLEKVWIYDDENFFTECQVIALCYKKLGETYINFVNGEFSIYIFDREKNIHFLYRDRWGVNNLYYKMDENMLYFASEMKCLISEETKISQKNLIEHFVFQFWISPSTIFDEVYCLRPGTYLKYSQDTREILDFSEYEYQESGNIIRIIENAVKRRIPTFQKRIFVSLSGWPDSNLILFFLKKYYKGEIIAYSFETSSNTEDIKFAKQNTRFLGVKHLIIDMEEYIPQNDFFEHEWLVSPPNIGKILKEKYPEYEDIKVEFGGDGKEELILWNNHYPYNEILLRYRYFLSLWKIKEYTITQEFLNKEMFDYNLQMIDKITLRNGIERRLPFTDYELLRFFKYKTYRQEAEAFLALHGISLVSWEYWYNLGLKFQYYDMKELKSLAQLSLEDMKTRISRIKKV